MSAAKHFRGFATSALDGKGRFSLPAPFRAVLFSANSNKNSLQLRANPVPESPFVAGFPDAQLDVFLGDIEAAHRAALARGEPFDKDQAEADFFSSVVEVSVDDGGRFTLPPGLADYAGIGKGVVILGASRQIRFWAPERFLATNPADPIVRASAQSFVEELRLREAGDKA